MRPAGARISGFGWAELAEHPKGQQSRGDKGEAEPGERVAEMVVGELDDRLAALRQSAGLPCRRIDGEAEDRPLDLGHGREADGVTYPFDAVGSVGTRREGARRLGLEGDAGDGLLACGAGGAEDRGRRRLRDEAAIDEDGAAGVGLESFRPSVATDGAFGLAMMFAFASFIGFEATAIYSEEARDRDRTIPRQT